MMSTSSVLVVKKGIWIAVPFLSVVLHSWESLVGFVVERQYIPVVLIRSNGYKKAPPKRGFFLP